MPQCRSVHTPTSRVYPFPGAARPCSARVRGAGAVLVALLGLVILPSWALNTAIDRATLRGLPGVTVVVEDIDPDVERAGLTRSQLQTDVELRLQLAGMRVLTREERLAVVGQPWLYIYVNVILHPQRGLTVYNIHVELHQAVSLQTGSEASAGAATWSIAALGLVDLNDISRIRESVRDLVDQFINAYLSVNPRPAGSSPPASTAPPPAPPPARRTR